MISFYCIYFLYFCVVGNIFHTHPPLLLQLKTQIKQTYSTRLWGQGCWLRCHYCMSQYLGLITLTQTQTLGGTSHGWNNLVPATPIGDLDSTPVSWLPASAYLSSACRGHVGSELTGRSSISLCPPPLPTSHFAFQISCLYFMVYGYESCLSMRFSISIGVRTIQPRS